MEHKEFAQLVTVLCKQDNLPQVLELLKVSEDEEIAQAALSLAGQFALAEVEGEQRIYHVTIEKSLQGEDQEYVEHIMNEGDDVVRFVAWFFEVMFDVKRKETYQAAGKTFQQPKR
ncbi:hypothetical protein [Vibrio hepatarius]|uniref:hypothetical protein n=1 Tax=Vibrio hepatarius TaxID=171383 RepID=UPI001C0A1B51|nr:hypothetical protein [Vibrio hepatarius]MBU2897411.1 hypothetical protein [Vibrio hepatarius]